MENLGDPFRWAETIEKYLGKSLGLFAIRLILVSLILGVPSIFLKFFLDLMLEYIWPGLLTIFSQELINQNIVILSLLIMVACLVTAYIGAIYLLGRFVRRRSVPQEIIDQLSDLRTEGIRRLNDFPQNNQEFDHWKIK